MLDEKRMEPTYHIQQKRKLQADLFFNDWDRSCQLICLPSDHPSILSEDCSWTQWNLPFPVCLLRVFFCCCTLGSVLSQNASQNVRPEGM